MTALQKKEQEFVALGNDCCKTQRCKRNCLEKNGENVRLVFRRKEWKNTRYQSDQSRM